MKIKYYTALNESFIKGLNNLSTEKLPIKTSIAIAKTIKTISEEVNILNSIRFKLIEEYGVEVKDGVVSIAKVEQLDEFNSKMVELLNSEIEIPLDTKIILPEDIKLSAADVLILEAILEF